MARIVVVALAVGVLALTAHAASTLNFLDKQGGSCRMHKDNDDIVSSCDVRLGTGQSILSNYDDILANSDAIELHDERINATLAQLESYRQAAENDINTLLNRTAQQANLIADLASEHESFVKKVTSLNATHAQMLQALKQSHELAVRAAQERDFVLEKHNTSIEELYDEVEDVKKQQKAVKRNCLDWLAAGETKNGVYEIRPNYQMPNFKIRVWCDFVADGGGYDMLPIVNGHRTCRRTDHTSCPAGMGLWVPRSKAHWTAVYNRFGGYGNGTLMHTAGIYGVANGCGGCGDHPMHSGTPQRDHWKALDGGRWWLRNDTYSEPSGDYSANCWLYIWDKNPHDVKFNDNMCHYCFTNYICSTNAKH